MLNIWRTASVMDSRGRWDNNYFYQPPHGLQLSGTPLNEALVSLNQLIPQFKKKTGVQKIQCITLTDGEAHPISFSKEFIDGDGHRYMGSRSTCHTVVCSSETPMVRLITVVTTIMS